jgi:predicted short-subunit dehydrogenase-like oxidoreductase (DUF2520 family)
MSVLNIIGCGRLGKTLGLLWRTHGILRVQDILNRSPASTQAAAAFIGGGRPARNYADLRPAPFTLIASCDDAIASCAEALARSGKLHGGDIVFHCSGALDSGVLATLRHHGALLASVHPVKSFADPTLAANSFADTCCGMEGHADALDALKPLFEAIGGKPFTIAATGKTLYHAATVICSNYLTALTQAGIETLAQAGLPDKTARQVLEPLARHSLDNVFRLGPAHALTGPITRGDRQVIARHLTALDGWRPDLARLYRILGRIALQLARSQDALSPQRQADIAGLLREDKDRDR